MSTIQGQITVPGSATAQGQDSWSRWFGRHLCWMIPISVFLVVRLFSGAPDLWIGMDQCKYLALGRSFPFHEVDNQSLFLMHPPMFGWIIGLLALVFPLITAGVLATLLLAVGNFVAMWAYGRSNSIVGPGLMVGMLFLALDRAGVSYDSHVSRVPAMLLTFTLGLWAFERWLGGAHRGLMWALLANALAHLVSDQAMQLLPCQVALYFLCKKTRSLREMGGFLLATGAIFLIWPAMRLAVYASHVDYPAGIDGLIESTRPIPWAGAIQPNLLPLTKEYVAQNDMTLSIWNLNLTNVVMRPLDLLLVPRAVTGGIVVVLIGAALAVKESRFQAIKWLTLSLLLYAPCAFGLLEWYGMGFVIPFSLLMAQGWSALLKLSGRPLVPQTIAGAAGLWAAIAWIQPAPATVHSLFVPTPGNHFLFARTPVTRAQVVCQGFAGNSDVDGIMAPVGITPEINFLTDKRVIALPFEPQLLEQHIREYRITHILLTVKSVLAGKQPVPDKLAGGLSTNYITAHPDRFSLVYAADEPARPFSGPEGFFVFRVNPPQKQGPGHR